MNPTLPPFVTLTHPVAGYPVYEIDHPIVRARVAGHGAHLMEWQPAGHDPVLYLSPQAVMRAGKSIRGGVPVCWPWFNAHPDRADLPSHGLARTRFWEPVSCLSTDTGAELVFTLADDDHTRALWPCEFRLTLRMQLGTDLQLSLRTENRGPEAFGITEALHSYLAVGDIRRTRIEGLAETTYVDTVGLATGRIQSGAVEFSGEVDRIYASHGPVTVQDASGRREVLVENTGSGSVVVWNPWIEKATALADLPDEDFGSFVCIETANVGAARIIVPPGGHHELGLRISVQRIAE